ncbi:MAG TPA: hypothetical protein VHM28_01960 [Anaerolineales bacterium]|jgi:predicted nucleic acid-binding Zn ribbon protein|nr:hypothetical protein [Anaerolineales bacterium]
MTKPTNPTPTPDDLLADFTDRVMEGKTAVFASTTDDELRRLEETVMRLNQAFPQKALDEKTLGRLQTDFKSRARKASTSSQPAWQSQQSRQRFILAFTAIAILVAIFIALPLGMFGNGSLTGTAGFQPSSTFLLAAFGLGCVIAVLIWLRLRK